ncbi:hypothetical protein [Actinoplanes sp. M2I2]|uniref:hypothetical protein n=1 Tax=Actinoplanes sp. M2I2 TaxID=1734444 RepID=UPI0020222802|nr:hypothetical protein [Actinoplanes sp. M2I2]
MNAVTTGDEHPHGGADKPARRRTRDRDLPLKLLLGTLTAAGLGLILWHTPAARARQEHGVSRIAEKYGIRPVGGTVEWYSSVDPPNMLILPDGTIKVCLVQGPYDDPLVLCEGREPARRK